MKPEATSTCQACGARVPVGLDFCPVCAFRGALEEGQETVELKINPTPSLSFEHYQILTREDGTPLESELGKSIHTPAGVTYGELKLNPAWDPLRKDPRFDNLLAQLAPRE